MQEVEASAEEEQSVVLKMKEGKRLNYTKIYDRDDFCVFQNLETGDILENLEDIEIEGVEQSEDVFVKDLEGVLEEQIKDAVEKEEVIIPVSYTHLTGTQNQNCQSMAG